MEHKWLLCDMHMHSYYSSINKKSENVKQMDASEFVELMLKNGVEVFSITDHNYFSKDYYNGIEEYINNKNLNIRIIPGVEFDTYINENDDVYIHICIYFSTTVNYEKLEKIVKGLYDATNDTKGKPNLAQIINKLFELNTKFIVIPHGDKSRGIFDVVLKNQFHDEPEFYKYAMYKVFNAYDVKPTFYDKSIKLWAANFYNSSKKG